MVVLSIFPFLLGGVAPAFPPRPFFLKGGAENTRCFPPIQYHPLTSKIISPLLISFVSHSLYPFLLRSLVGANSPLFSVFFLSVFLSLSPFTVLLTSADRHARPHAVPYFPLRLFQNPLSFPQPQRRPTPPTHPVNHLTNRKKGPYKLFGFRGAGSWGC